MKFEVGDRVYAIYMQDQDNRALIRQGVVVSYSPWIQDYPYGVVPEEGGRTVFFQELELGPR